MGEHSQNPSQRPWRFRCRACGYRTTRVFGGVASAFEPCPRCRHTDWEFWQIGKRTNKGSFCVGMISVTIDPRPAKGDRS